MLRFVNYQGENHDQCHDVLVQLDHVERGSPARPKVVARLARADGLEGGGLGHYEYSGIAVNYAWTAAQTDFVCP